MEALATYLIKSSVWLTGFTLVYVLFLRNERFFLLNRIYLVSGILGSIIFPLFTWHYTVLLPAVPSIEVSDPVVQGIVMPEESFTTQNMLLLGYLAGILYLIFRILRQTLPVFRIIRKSETSQYSSAKLIRTDAYLASFSFFSFVFVNPSIDEIETNEIVNHELEHIRQQHWIDLLLFEILRTMQWFNPVSWLYGHLIRQNHEYLADERALQRSSNPAIYRAALLNQLFGGPVISLANSFNYSLNKKRFNMMKHTIKSPFRKLKLLLVLPLMAGVFYAFATPEYKFIGGPEIQSQQKSLYTISKDKIDIPFTTQFQKSDLETVKTELAKLGMKIDYTSLDFTKDGSLKQITANVKRSDGGSVSFTSGELTPTNYPRFKTESDGSFGVYFQKAITGKVVSEDRKPLKGASVVVSGKTIGTVTDANGNFKLVLTDESPIVISYVGFETQKVNPDFGKEMQIILKTRIVGIDPVGNDTSTSTKESKPLDITDKVLVIIDEKESTKAEMDKINPDKIESIDVLKNKASIEKYGEKGKDGVVLITLKNDNPNFQTIKVQTNSPLKFGNSDGSWKKPLIVKDGVIVENQEVNNIPPETIESINVLKGEQATKIYGNKGRNGVVLITSKKGTSTTQNGTIEVKVTGYANDKKEITKNEGSVYTIVEEMPSFPGGVEALNAFINGNLKYPPIALENGIQGRVFVSFVVGKDGEIKNVKVSRGVDVSIDKEAMRIVKSMPNWYPGKQNGEMVEVAYEIPVSFELKNYRPVSKEKLTVKSYTETKTTYTKSRPDPKVSKIKPTVDQGTQTLQLIIVPNPTNDKATITLEGSDSNKKLDVRVYDMDGKIIRKESKHGPAFSLSFTSIVSGTYLIVANDGTNQYSGHLVVNH